MEVPALSNSRMGSWLDAIVLSVPLLQVSWSFVLSSLSLQNHITLIKFVSWSSPGSTKHTSFLFSWCPVCVSLTPHHGDFFCLFNILL